MLIDWVILLVHLNHVNRMKLLQKGKCVQCTFMPQYRISNYDKFFCDRLNQLLLLKSVLNNRKGYVTQALTTVLLKQLSLAPIKLDNQQMMKSKCS